MPVPLGSKPNTLVRDPNHPLYANTVLLVPFTEGSGNATEVVNSVSGTLDSGAAWATDADLGGRCVDLSGGVDDGVNFGVNGLPYGNGDLTIFVVAKTPASVVGRQHTAVEFAGNLIHDIFAGLGDSGQMQFVLAGVEQIDSGVAVMPVSTVCTICYSFDRGTQVRFRARRQDTEVTIIPRRGWI